MGFIPEIAHLHYDGSGEDAESGHHSGAQHEQLPEVAGIEHFGWAEWLDEAVQGPGT